MRIIICCVFLFAACTPTSSRDLTCSTDDDCFRQTGTAAGSRCDLSIHLCVCNGLGIPGCEEFIDGGTDSATTMPSDTGILGEGGGVDTIAPQCQSSNTCPAATPICSATKTCALCTASSQCASKDPTMPSCRGDGVCVQCATNDQCPVTTPFCDSTTNRCVSCLSSTTCPPTAPICAAGTCAPCATSEQCGGLKDPSRTFCSTTGTCVGCLTSATCGGVTPICNTAAQTCGACTASSQCAGIDPAKPICSTSGACVQCAKNEECPAGVCDTTANKCVGCLTSATCGGITPICNTTTQTCGACMASSQCAAKNVATPACRSDGQCVACTSNDQCSGGTPICDTTTNKCVGCLTSATCGGVTPICNATTQTCGACTASSQCAAKNAATPTCRSDGQCVACTSNDQCSGGTPICDTTTNKCVGCLTSATCGGVAPICNTTTQTCGACTASSQCAAKNAATPACRSDGQCVACTSNDQCSGGTPICDTTTNKCRTCTADAECASIGPGVCMSHQDGRCASNAETVVVTSSSTLPSTSVPTGIDLVVIRGGVSGAISWTLPSSPKISIVGQSNGTTAATLTGPASSTTETATIKVSGGDLYIRGLSVTAGSPGIWATGGNVLRLDRVAVSNNTAGGILLDGAGFDIKNTTVNGNGSNIFDQPFGGIRIQNTPAASSSPKAISLSTISNNLALGVSCATGTSALLTPAPNSVLAASNTTGDIVGACGFTSCAGASATCGAQPQ